MTDVITVQEALDWVGRNLTDPVDDSAMAVIVGAVNTSLNSIAPAGCTDPVPADMKLAGLLLASRWYSRRNSPDGLVGFGDYGTASIRNLDPDIRDIVKVYKRKVVG